MQINRDRAKALGAETVQILSKGHYLNDKGKTVSIRDAVNQSIAGTQTYSPDAKVLIPECDSCQTVITVRNETTLDAAARLFRAGQNVLALNFASAKHPGGGFLGGARAQEESLARSSGLYACIRGNPMYAFHCKKRDPMYSDYAIYSRDVPVIRDDDGSLLDQPFYCSFITCPAVNAKAVLRKNPRRVAAVEQAMASRIHRVLSIALAQGHRCIILGAWGCGAFGNDGAVVAKLFAQALDGKFKDHFQTVVFAITDWSTERRFIGPFEDAFSSA